MSFSLLTPATPEEAIRLLAEPGAPATAVLAGGTDLLFELGGARPGPARVLSLRRLPWRTVQWAGTSLVIGSTAPLSEVERAPRVRAELPGLWAAVRAVGAVPLRHRATIGGNLARAAPASDLIPILLALDASVQVVGPAGSRTLSIADLVRGPRATSLGNAELIESVRIPEPRPSSYLWQRVRPANDISQVGVAAAWSPAGNYWRIAAGGVGPIPILLPEAERHLASEHPEPGSIRAAASAAAARAEILGDKRATESYRRQVLEVLIARAVTAAADRGLSS